jgi:hypothetical protein
VVCVKSVGQDQKRCQRTGEVEDPFPDDKDHPVRIVVWSKADHEEPNRREDGGEDEQLELVLGLGDAVVLPSLMEGVLVGEESAQNSADL